MALFEAGNGSFELWQGLEVAGGVRVAGGGEGAEGGGHRRCPRVRQARGGEGLYMRTVARNV